jgi:hypothetical protein
MSISKASKGFLKAETTCTLYTHKQVIVQYRVAVTADAADPYKTTTSEKLVRVVSKEVKVILRKAELAQGVPDRLRPRIFLTFGTTSVVGRQPYAPAAFTPGETPGTHF